MFSDRIIYMSIDWLQPNPFEVRYKEERYEEQFKKLVQGIKVDKFWQPIIVREKNGKFQVIENGRMFRASKAARLEKVPVIVRVADDKDVKMWALIENLHRENLTDTEKSNSIRVIFETYGYDLQTSIRHLIVLQNDRIRGDELDVPRQFVELSDSIGYPETTQYMMLKLARDLNPRVLEYAEKMELDTNKKLMLTRPMIKKDPKLQKMPRCRGRPGAL